MPKAAVLKNFSPEQAAELIERVKKELQALRASETKNLGRLWASKKYLREVKNTQTKPSKNLLPPKIFFINEGGLNSGSILNKPRKFFIIEGT